MTSRGTATPPVTLEALLDGTVDADAFDHEAHVYTAWLMLRRYPLQQAISRYTAALRNLTMSLGVPGKYHDTVTKFYLLIINERRSDTPSDDWPAFLQGNGDLFRQDDNILYRYYSAGLIKSDQARRSFVQPDRLEKTFDHPFVVDADGVSGGDAR